MSKIKRMLAATLAATICLTPSFAFQMNDITAQAASASAGTYVNMNIPDEDISCTSSKVKNGGGGYLSVSGTNWTANSTTYTCAASKAKNALTSGWTVSQMLRKYNFEYTVEVPNNSTTNTVAKMKKLISATIQFRTDDRTAGYTSTLPLTITKDTANSTSSTLVYKVKSKYSSYGNKVKINLNFKSGLNSYKTVVKNVVTSTGDFGYTNTTASLSDGTGEKVHLQIDLQNTGIATAEYREWLRMLVRFVNSVSDITGIQHKNIYVMFEDELSSNPNCDHFVISNDGEAVTVRMSPGYLPTIHESILAGQLDWGLMHELAHCYSFTGSKTSFAEAFNYNLDDVHTNVRAFTAMQNCDQLRSVEVNLDGTNVGTYKKAMYNAYKTNTSYEYNKMLYAYYKYTTNCYDGWLNLEKYFHGQVESALLNNDVVYGAIETINESSTYTYGQYGTKPLIFETADSYRFINGFYYLCKNTSGYGASKAQYKRFIKNIVGAENYASFIAKETNNSNLGEAIKSQIPGDLTLNKSVNATDVTWFNGYMNNTRGLSPEGAFNADYNKDGYINQADKTAISALIS